MHCVHLKCPRSNLVKTRTFNLKLRPNDRNIEHIPTLLAQHLQASGKRLQHFNATYRNIVGRNMLRGFGRLVLTCCDMLGIENLTSAQARVQHCYTNLAKWCCMKNLTILKFEPPTRNIAQHLATCRNRVAKRMLHVAPKNVAIYVALKYWSFGQASKGHNCCNSFSLPNIIN